MPVVCHRCYAPRVEELLRRRREVQERYDAGGTPTFLEETRAVRSPRSLSGPPYPALISRRGVWLLSDA